MVSRLGWDENKETKPSRNNEIEEQETEWDAPKKEINNVRRRQNRS